MAGRPRIGRPTPPMRGRPGSRRETSLPALLLLVGLLVGACGVAGVTPSPAASPSAPASAGAEASGDGAVGPSPTWWPGGVVEAVLNLGKADAEIQKASTDLQQAAASEDLEAMWGAADGLATLLERLLPQVDRIRDYPETVAAAAAYDAALPVMLEGAKQVRDSITSGDAAGIAAGSQRLAQGVESYAEARRLVGPLVDQALLMQRLLTK